MTGKTIDHTTLVGLVEEGAVGRTRAVARTGGWAVTVDDEEGPRLLTAQLGLQVRVFPQIGTVLAYLKQLGISEFEVDATAFDPKANDGYDARFGQHVRIALDEADDPRTVWIAHEDVERGWARQRALLIASADAKP